MKLRCTVTDSEYLGQVVGDPAKQLEECLNWLSRHLMARQPDLMKQLMLRSQMSLAAMVMTLGEPVGESEAATLWQKTLDEHVSGVLKAIGCEIEDEGKEDEDVGDSEGDEQEVYNMGFEDCQSQVVKLLREKGLMDEALEIEQLVIEMEDEAEDAGSGGSGAAGEVVPGLVN